MSILIAMLLYALGVSIIGVLTMAILAIESKWQKENRISEEILSRAIRALEESNTDNLDAMIRYFEEQEEQIRYNIKG